MEYDMYNSPKWTSCLYPPHGGGRFIVARAMPGEPEHRMVVAFYHAGSSWWFVDKEFKHPLLWKPTFYGPPPMDPPWPVPEDLHRFEDRPPILSRDVYEGLGFGGVASHD